MSKLQGLVIKNDISKMTFLQPVLETEVRSC